MPFVTRICLACDHTEITYCDKDKEYEAITVCPKCNGAFADRFRYDQYKNKNKQPLLTIELQDESSVPKVFYKGEEVKYKSNVFFDWDTSDERSPGGLTYAIEHYEANGTANRIERRIKDHA